MRPQVTCLACARVVTGCYLVATYCGHEESLGRGERLSELPTCAHRVYNLAVTQSSAYLVTEGEVLAHNSSARSLRTIVAWPSEAIPEGSQVLRLLPKYFSPFLPPPLREYDGGKWEIAGYLEIDGQLVAVTGYFWPILQGRLKSLHFDILRIGLRRDDPAFLPKEQREAILQELVDVLSTLGISSVHITDFSDPSASRHPAYFMNTLLYRHTALREFNIAGLRYERDRIVEQFAKLHGHIRAEQREFAGADIPQELERLDVLASRYLRYIQANPGLRPL